MGADLCGIADVEKLTGAPAGFHPRDTLPDCKSVIVFAKKFAVGTILCNGMAPYTITRNILSEELDVMSVHLCSMLEDEGIISVPTGTIGPTLRDEATGRYRNIVSAKHCAVAAGLGRIGRNTQLVTPEYGNMVWITAVLCEGKFEADIPLEGSPCPPECRLCVEACPVHAVGEPEMNQTLCNDYAFNSEKSDDFLFRCNACRTVCPNRFGALNRPSVIKNRREH